jgi:FixJ family two-component response regulator
MTIGRKSKLVTIVDDEKPFQNALQDLIESEGLVALCFDSAEQFLESGAQHRTACLITDIRMPGMSGLDLQARLNTEQCPIPTIFITAHGDEKLRLQAMRGGAVKFLAKPFDSEILLESVRAALGNQS